MAETTRASSRSITDDVVLSWTVHLARDRPFRLLLSLAASALVCAAGYAALGLLGAAAAAFVMLSSLADFLFPVHYVLTTRGASCRMLFKLSQIAWENVRRCYVDEFGVKLSPLDRKSRLEAFRGVYLRFAGNADRVIETVKEMRPQR